jgi:hypothetical protein
MDVTSRLNPVISHIGMVTDALWLDVTGDKQKELIIVGEWMTPRIFSYQKGKFEEVKTNLDHLFGWWQTVAADDLDGDGDNDLVFGNYGENFYLQPFESNPVKLWVNDFDYNGITDKIFSRRVDDKDVTVFLKKDFTDALPSLKKEILKHHAFAGKTIQTLFSPELLKTASVKIFNYSKSCIAYNGGGGNFKLIELPFIAQLSSINSILCKDINRDGKSDLIFGGNITDCLPQFGRLDANYGAVLINSGNRGFIEMPSSQTGISITGMVRDIDLIGGNNNNYLLFLRNNDYPVLFRLRK